MKAYKIFNSDWTCKNFQFEVGKEYKVDEKPVLCEKGFHACLNLHDCFAYYPCVPWNKIAEVELLGDVVGTNENKQVRLHYFPIVEPTILLRDDRPALVCHFFKPLFIRRCLAEGSGI